MNGRLAVIVCSLSFLAVQFSYAANVVPDVVQMPGTQPSEIGNLESPNKCDNCHGGYNSSVEPAHNWRGSMMANAGRDPIFWATLAIAEQDFDGAGDLCIRCHSTAGWLAGRSTPTDGSALQAGDSDGVECDYCHKLTNPDNSEHLGVMNAPFVAHDPGGEGYYGSGMSSLWAGSDKLGPYNNADARHQFMQSEFHRDRNFCGTCHDVSNPVTGDLAHNFGALFTDEIVAPNGSTIDAQVAFNNPPYRYGVVERTFSEFMAGQISQTLVDDIATLPGELTVDGKALREVFNAAYDAGARSANYQNPPAPRYFSCQTCHMRAVTGKGANKNSVPTRVDLPLHDMTGGNYWMAEAIKYLDNQGKLRLGGGLTELQRQAMDDAALRAKEQLRLAASLKVEGNEVYIYNHTGHKLITGYPEGRRMWLNVRWFDGTGSEMTAHEIGAYGPLRDGAGNPVTVPNPAGGPDVQVASILDLSDPNARIYEAHMGMTQEWANHLINEVGVPSELVLQYDRHDPSITTTLGDLQAMGAGSVLPTFHFVLNNTVYHDNRIPPYGMSATLAEQRNAAPVFHEGEEGYEVDNETGWYPYYDELDLTPPPGAASAIIELLYQPTSWEYIQFLYEANDRSSAFLGQEGVNMLEAWLATGMAAPEVMASATWGSGEPPPPECNLDAPTLDSATAGNGEVTLSWTGPPTGTFDGCILYYDQADKAQKVADVPCPGGSYTDTGLSNGNQYCYKASATSQDPACESPFSNILCATPQPSGEVSYASVTIEGTCRLAKGKGKKGQTSCEDTGDAYAPGDQVVIQLRVSDDVGAGLPSAVTSLTVSGPQTTALTSGVSDGNGQAEASWNTQAPNKKGNGGTPTGGYQISVSGLDSSTHEWDGSSVTVSVTLDSAAAATGHQHRHGKR